MSWLSRSWSSPVLRAGALSLAPLAAGAFGVMVMAEHGATGAQRGLQSGALALGVMLAASLARLGRERLGAACPWAAGAAIAVLGSTLASEGMSGARRWILLGPIRMHASSLASPMILVGAALVAYLTTTLIVPLFGSYPVPVMGFGASPILGVALCVGVVAIN